MVLPRTPIVLCELAEDMEYEVKRKLEGNLSAQPRIIFLLFNAILPETIK